MLSGGPRVHSRTIWRDYIARLASQEDLSLLVKDNASPSLSSRKAVQASDSIIGEYRQYHFRPRQLAGKAVWPYPSTVVRGQPALGASTEAPILASNQAKEKTLDTRSGSGSACRVLARQLVKRTRSHWPHHRYLCKLG